MSSCFSSLSISSSPRVRVRVSPVDQVADIFLFKVLIAGGADPEHGTPSALECIKMFKQEEKWQQKFESAPGRGKASSSAGASDIRRDGAPKEQ